RGFRVGPFANASSQSPAAAARSRPTPPTLPKFLPPTIPAASAPNVPAKRPPTPCPYSRSRSTAVSRFLTARQTIPQILCWHCAARWCAPAPTPAAQSRCLRPRRLPCVSPKCAPVPRRVASSRPLLSQQLPQAFQFRRIDLLLFQQVKHQQL